VNPTAVLLFAPLALAPAPQERASPARPATDPTAMDPELARVLSRAGAGPVAGPAAVATPFPSVAIRALVVPRTGEPVAIVEVDGVRVRVEAGARIGFGQDEHLRVDAVGEGRIVLVRESTQEARVLR
jgi:hypothetical protein